MSPVENPANHYDRHRIAVGASYAVPCTAATHRERLAAGNSLYLVIDREAGTVVYKYNKPARLHSTLL
jgi:hypothetical protein